MKVELCDICARPLWEGLCAYCLGVKETKQKMREMVENLSMHENDEYDNGCEKAKSDVLNALDKI